MRVKIFVLVAILFGVTIFGIIGLRYLEVDRAIGKSTREIEIFVKKLDLEKRKDVLEYLNISIIEIQNQIQAIFNKISDLEWVQERFLPSNYDYYENHWKDSAVLMLGNEWIDLIQTTAGDKLASSIIVHPPYLDSFFYIPINSILSVILTVNIKGEIIPYIGVPYWTNAISKVNGAPEKIFLQQGVKKEDVLLFSINDLLEIDASELKIKKVRWETNPLDTAVVIKHEDYVILMDHVIESIALVQLELKKHKELTSILTTPDLLEKWAVQKLSDDPRNIVKVDGKCKDRLCCGWESVLKEQPWMIEEGWNSRYEQNQLIWKVGELFGSGIWGFDPLGKRAPKGICCLVKKDLKVVKPFYPMIGILMEEIVEKEIIPFMYDCDPGDESCCVSKNFDIVAIPERKGVYFTKTMVFKSMDKVFNTPLYGTLTLGVSMNDILQQLALVIPGSILFVKETGEKIFFHQDGKISDDQNWGQIDFTKLVNEETGVIKNINGKEFLFVHFVPITEGKGQVFVLELRQNVFEMLGDLKIKASELMHWMFLENIILGFLGIVIALIALNHILKRGIAPLTQLAVTTKLIALGRLESVHIPDLWMKRKDEVGVLCLAFEQMVREMKEGVKVRSLLDKVVSKEIANKILRDGVKLGGESREVTVLFADIRNFTQISENMKPVDVLEMLNSCLTILSRVIDEHQGVIDKYIGDEIMAIFGAPVDSPNPGFQAVTCAITMMEVLKEWNESRKNRNMLPLEIGISIHTGNVIAGNIGAENHLSYTVLGHNVNLASRIADHAQGMEILITEETFRSTDVSENITVELTPPISFKGISKPIPLYRVLI